MNIPPEYTFTAGIVHCLQNTFSDVTGRILRYHLKKLADLGLILKHGRTRGSLYSLKKEANILLSASQKL
jgi:DNA-binding transcriptional ArsR family regulator